jgi:hypothetical protein
VTASRAVGICVTLEGYGLKGAPPQGQVLQQGADGGLNGAIKRRGFTDGNRVHHSGEGGCADERFAGFRQVEAEGCAGPLRPALP